MLRIHLVFDGKLAKTVCGFTNENDMVKFLHIIMMHDGKFKSTVTVDPKETPIPTFKTLTEAVEYFGL